MGAAEIVEPGRYDYDLKVKFPSTHIPEHTPPAFRNAAAIQTTKTRNASGQFDLAEHVGRTVLQDALVRKVCADLNCQTVQVVRFELRAA